jgi:diaminopimelate decarboxylase
LADLIDARCVLAGQEKRIQSIDIGGGLATNCSSDQIFPTFGEYADALDAVCPSLFSSTRTVVTEFGKAIVMKCGAVVARVEAVLDHGDTAHDGFVTAICHAGADLLLRSAYCPEKFPVRVALLDDQMNLLSCAVDNSDQQNESVSGFSRREMNVTIAGPLCFSGDNIVKHAKLPCPVANDVCVVLDTGANAISLFSKHCSRYSPSVYVFRSLRMQKNHDSSVESCFFVRCVREKENDAQLLQFWG